MPKVEIQLCWNCEKATNGNLCSWAENFTLPQGAEVDKKGYICTCPLYEFDGHWRTMKEAKKMFGVEPYRVRDNLKIFKRLYRMCAKLESVPTFTQIQKLFNISRQTPIQHYEIYYQLYCENKQLMFMQRS